MCSHCCDNRTAFILDTHLDQVWVIELLVQPALRLFRSWTLLVLLAISAAECVQHCSHTECVCWGGGSSQWQADAKRAGLLLVSPPSRRRAFRRAMDVTWHAWGSVISSRHGNASDTAWLWYGVCLSRLHLEKTCACAGGGVQVRWCY